MGAYVLWVRGSGVFFPPRCLKEQLYSNTHSAPPMAAAANEDPLPFQGQPSGLPAGGQQSSLPVTALSPGAACHTPLRTLCT